jgi:Lrp/AsnC family leucine-responsive transcriptional regulator
MKNELKIDGIGMKIVAILQVNARTPNAEIARRVGLTTSAVQDRIKKLEARGVIQGYSAKIDPSALGLGLTAFVGVRIHPHRQAPDIGMALAEKKSDEQVYHLAGEECFLVKIRCADTLGLETVLLRINDIEGVVATRTTIALRPVAELSGAIVRVHARETDQIGEG